MELYIDLEKAINRSKLVQKRVMVRGQNGKIYYRMQWVDPRTGQPASEGHAKLESEQPTHRTQKEHIDNHVKKMSREHKYQHLEKHGITWKRNDHPAIDHKNAVEALKRHLHDNPHLAGAEHLPKEADGKTKDGLDLTNDFVNKYKKHPELLYKMMKHLGVTDHDLDPRTVDGQQHTSKGGNGKGDIMHMKNMMGLKRHLKENPHKIDEMKNHPDFGSIHEDKGSTPSVATPEKPKTEPKPQDKPQSKAQKGGNTIKGILDSMSSEDKYALCKKLGIAEGDPRLDPSINEKMRPIHHMKNMMALKKAIEADPSHLNTNPDTGDISDDEKERLNGLEGKEKLAHEVQQFLDRASRDLKLQWAGDYADHEHMKNRKTNDHEHIDNMHKVGALKKILMDDPSIMDELKPELEREELSNLKIGNKMMGKILREVAGLKGIGDITAGYDKGKEWEFGDESSAMIQDDDEGEPILSIFHVDKDGNEHDLAIPMKKVKQYLDGLKTGENVEVKPKELPLHKKPLKAIWDALHEDFDKNYTKEVGDVLKPEIGKMWEASGKNSQLSHIAYHSVIGVETGTLEKLLEKYGVPIDNEFVKRADINSDAFKKVVWGHKVEKVKGKNAMDYLEKSQGGGNDTWVLHESAKHWSPDERADARKDFIKGNLHIQGLDDYDNKDDRHVMITNHVHKSLELVPFDLMTDVFASGCGLHFMKTNKDGKPHRGNYQSSVLGGIAFDHGYIDDLSSLSEEHPMHHRPSPRPVLTKEGIDTGKRSGYHPFSDTCAHEFAHAIDNYLSGGGSKYVQWDKTDRGKKYTGKHANVVAESYKAAVEKSNPQAKLGKRVGGQTYLFHLDEWMSHYEGRIYDWTYYNNNLSKNNIESTPDGRGMRDKSWEATRERGLEHWSENVSRVFNALHAYRMWREDTGDTSMSMDHWAEQMHHEFTGEGYGDESNSNDGGFNGKKYLTSYRRAGLHDRDKPMNKMPVQAYGYLYHTMKQRHPKMFEGIHKILVRPDFVNDKSVADPISRAEKDDHVRKSGVELIINLGE